MSELAMTPWMKARVGARLLLLQARWDPARMQGPGFAFALDPWLAACWGAEPEGLLAARTRHLEYFNTHPIAAWLAAGIVCRQEAAAAALSGAAREAAIARIRSLKTGLGASLAGLYDSFFWGALRPASALAGILAAQAAYRLGSPHAPAWAAVTALCVYNLPAFAARVLGLLRGAADGERAVAGLTKLPVQPWIIGLRRATVAGALAAFAISAGMLGGGDRLTAALTFAAGLILTWRGVSPLSQLAFAGLGGMAASAAGLWP
ncbi:MAG: PTS system mannose/fructose/sorbose family transporter subunit IID [Elusimicrobia bacterium]|nr:PTS system mannose/fructose/sorbose family transporter subunit IID [Elusimicrobiota bacterium]